MSHITERDAHIEYDMSLANLKSADIPPYSIDSISQSAATSPGGFSSGLTA